MSGSLRYATTNIDSLGEFRAAASDSIEQMQTNPLETHFIGPIVFVGCLSVCNQMNRELKGTCSEIEVNEVVEGSTDFVPKSASNMLVNFCTSLGGFAF